MIKYAQKKITNEINSPEHPRMEDFYTRVKVGKKSNFVSFAICINFIADYQI